VMETTDTLVTRLDRGGDFTGRSCSAPPAFRLAPLTVVAGPAVVQRSSTWANVLGVASLEDSDSEFFDFEPLSGSGSSSSSASSEIPEAILEESSDDDHKTKLHSSGSDAECSATENSSGQQSASISKPVLISAWTSTWTAGFSGFSPQGRLPVTARETPGGRDEAVHISLLPGAALTPVRRARVRGTILLPTSSREPSHTEPGQHRSTTAPLIRPSTATFAPPRRAREAEEALAIERLRHEEELERQAKEAADRQAILKALDDDRAVLATSYKQAQAELSRVEAELSRVQAELSHRTSEVWDLRDEQDILQREVNRLPPRAPVCVCCIDAPATMAPVPCGHLALCEACAVRLDRFTCPVCRHPSECMIHIYTP